MTINGLLMKFNLAFFYSMLALSASQLMASSDAFAKQQEKAERWFEIEVILFEQLGNKTALAEQFPEDISASNLPKYQQSFDLLSEYLQPKLTGIKQFLPLCGEKGEQQLFLESLQNINAPFPKIFQQIEQVPTFIMPDFTEGVGIESTTEENNNKSSQTGQNEIVSEVNSPLEESLPLMGKASKTTSFEFDLQKEPLEQPIFSTTQLCIITQKEIESLFNEQQLNHINIDSFDVNKLPSTLNASGAHLSDSPYLIADGSLLLKDINQRLRWSKEFKPLLHFGWRQVGITQHSAIPLKLFAGQHVAYEYQQTLANYQMDLAKAKEYKPDESSMSVEEVSNSAQTELENNELNISIEHRKQALKQLFSRVEQLSQAPINEDELSNTIENISKQSLESITTTNLTEQIRQSHSIGELPIDIKSLPKAPLQPWFLNGFLKIHLDHYLYITADFNVFNQNNTKNIIEINNSEDDKNDKVKLINFSQNRRVITGEIHYFDHPYIGMIVQIRRFDPTKPKGEQVSQAIK